MGQGGSKGSSVVHVQVDSGYYYAGDTVTGTVVLHAEQAIDVKAISVKVTGVEKTRWVETQHSSTSSESHVHNVHDVTYGGKHMILKHKIPLKDKSTIAPGDYQWPISFQVPANIPGTFHYNAPDNRTNASIEYKLKVVVDQEGLMKSDIKKTLKFDVLQRNKSQAPSGPLVLDVDQPISAWCCINKGHISMRVAAATDSYLPGEFINLDAQIDNKSSTPVEVVEMKLHQRLHLTGESLLGTTNKHIDVVRVATRQQATNAAQGAPGLVSQYVGRLELDRGIEATCLGKVIRSSYELEVTAKTGCCLSQVKLKQPIFINDPQPHAAPPVMQPPPGWAPQVYAPVTFALPAADCYSSWQQQQPVSGAPAAQQYAGGYNQPPQTSPEQHQQQGYQQQPQYPPQQPQYQQDLAYYPQQQPGYPQQQQQQQYQPDPQAYPVAYTSADAQSAVPGAVCYLGQQQQQADPYVNKAGGGYMTSGQAAGPAPVGQWGYPQQSMGAAPGAPSWPTA